MSHVLLYDGTCGLCAASVQFVLRHERQTTLRFAPLQGEFAEQLVARHPELRGVDSLVWVETASATAAEAVAVRSDAVLQVIAYLGGWWLLLSALRIVPRRLRDAAYDIVAAHRHRVSAAQCFMPDPAQRERFVP